VYIGLSKLIGKSKCYHYQSTKVKETKNRQITEETKESMTDPEFFIRHKINVPIDYIPLSKNWLNLEVLRLWKCGIDIGNGHYSSHSLPSVNNNNQIQEQEEKEEEATSNGCYSLSRYSKRRRRRERRSTGK
jgi:hypothetical protein